MPLGYLAHTASLILNDLGDPRQPGTLHYLHQDGQLNDYEKAIMSILSILQKYDSDKKFPVLGFGAKYNGEIRHAFQCGTASEAVGVKGVLSAYRDVFGSGLVMSRPTVFNEVIEYAAGRAEQSLDAALASGGQTYSILLLLTDGCVSDIPATAECLKGIADKPISVVMVVSATVIFFCCSEVWHNIVILLSHASDRVWDRLTFRAWTFWTAWASRECGM
mmetsp:Transcript_5815/g.13747  ORF Transcript_5815/g.13747 Transcript_5815/m.13747 type:complete len:220 (+) Transcript_5815:1060-1719(+)